MGGAKGFGHCRGQPEAQAQTAPLHCCVVGMPCMSCAHGPLCVRFSLSASSFPPRADDSNTYLHPDEPNACVPTADLLNYFVKAEVTRIGAHDTILLKTISPPAVVNMWTDFKKELGVCFPSALHWSYIRWAPCCIVIPHGGMSILRAPLKAPGPRPQQQGPWGGSEDPPKGTHVSGSSDCMPVTQSISFGGLAACFIFPVG